MHAMSRTASTCTAFTVVSPPVIRRAHPSVLSLRCASPFPDVKNGKSNDADKRDCLEEGDYRIPQCQVAQNKDRGCYEVEDNRSCKGDAALAAVGEDNPRQEQADEDKDGEPVDLADGVCKGRVEIDQEDRDDKEGIDNFLNDGSSLLRLLLSLFSRPESMTENAYGVGIGQLLFSSIPHHNTEEYYGRDQCQEKHVR